MSDTDLAECYPITKSCRLRGAAKAERTRIRMASEPDEEEEQVSGEWRGTRY